MHITNLPGPIKIGKKTAYRLNLYHFDPKIPFLIKEQIGGNENSRASWVKFLLSADPYRHINISSYLIQLLSLVKSYTPELLSGPTALTYGNAVDYFVKINKFQIGDVVRFSMRKNEQYVIKTGTIADYSPPYDYLIYSGGHIYTIRYFRIAKI